MNEVDECLSQIRDAETEDLIESYKSFFDDEYILSFDDYKKFHKFQMQYFTDFLCFGNLQLEPINEENSKAKILYLDSYGK